VAWHGLFIPRIFNLSILRFVTKFKLHQNLLRACPCATYTFWKAIKGLINIFTIGGDSTRVARWYIFRPKIAIWVNFGGSCNERYWHVLWPFGLFYGRFVYLVDVGYLVFFPRFGMLYQEKSGNPGQHLNENHDLRPKQIYQLICTCHSNNILTNRNHSLGDT
jgi:hypothetical protein